MDRSSALLIKNDNLNTAFSSKKWEFLYILEKEAFDAGLSFNPGDKNYFIKKYREHYFWVDIKLDRISVKFKGDSAEVSNLQLVSKLMPGKFIQDTVYHVWIYNNNKWYLTDFSNHKYPHDPYADPSWKEKEDSIMKTIMK